MGLPINMLAAKVSKRIKRDTYHILMRYKNVGNKLLDERFKNLKMSNKQNSDNDSTDDNDFTNDDYY